jgi:hypothetical protein
MMPRRTTADGHDPQAGDRIQYLQNTATAGSVASGSQSKPVEGCGVLDPDDVLKEMCRKDGFSARGVPGSVAMLERILTCDPSLSHWQSARLYGTEMGYLAAWANTRF